MPELVVGALIDHIWRVTPSAARSRLVVQPVTTDRQITNYKLVFRMGRLKPTLQPAIMLHPVSKCIAHKNDPVLRFKSKSGLFRTTGSGAQRYQTRDPVVTATAAFQSPGVPAETFGFRYQLGFPAGVQISA